MKFGGNADLQKNELQNAKVQNLSAAPTTGLVKGLIYFDTVLNQLGYYNGTGWIYAGAAPADATTTTKGIIQLAGDLAGTAAAPTVPNKANLASPTFTGTPSAPTASAGTNTTQIATTAFATAADTVASTADRARANHTGTQLAVTISDFDTQVRTSRLDQMAAPTTGFSMGTNRIINMGDPTGAQDAATKNYVDSVAQGLDAKQSVRAATTGQITIATAPAALDGGVTLAAGDRILVKDQSSASQNGIYVWSSTGTPLTRAADMDTWTEVQSAFVFVEEGVTNGDTGWVSTADRIGTLGTTIIPWTQFSGAGSIIPGVGLFKTGNQIDIGIATNGGIQGNADDLQLARPGVPAAPANGVSAAATIGGALTQIVLMTGDGTKTSWALSTTSLGWFAPPLVQVYDETNNQIIPDSITPTSSGAITIVVSPAISAGITYTVRVVA